MQLVGITGRAGAGKDTIADYLVSQHGFTKLSFAAVLKTMMHAAGFPEPANREDKEKPIDGFSFTWREAAQKLGTEWGRALDQDLWVKVMERHLQNAANLYAATPNHARFVFSDVRFENEAAMIRRLGGKMLFVHGRAADLGANAAHASEAGIELHPNVDLTIDNSGDLNWTRVLVNLALDLRSYS